MAKKSKQTREGYGKLLDAWSPPRGAGDPIGCIATSFTFSCAFFEEECLARFLELESDPLEDGPAYIIEREEKMAQVVCACAIVDQHHCRGLRSLRWDLLPARVAGGILHAKVSLLVWTDATRLIVGSANITEDGYRRNLEVFSTFDYASGGECPIDLLYEFCRFLRRCADRSQHAGQPPSSALRRVRTLLDRVERTPASWGRTTEECRRTGLSAHSVIVGEGGSDAFASLNAVWPSSTPPNDAYVVSPFFEPPDKPNAPARRLWDCLRKRGDARVSFCVDAEDTPDGGVLARAPASLLEAQPRSRSGVETAVFRIRRDSTRPLHAKAISLEDGRWRLYMVGSSNFTSAGLGIPEPRNLEANVAYLVDSAKQATAYKAMDRAFPDIEPLEIDDIRWLGGGASEDEPGESEALLPGAFSSATYACDETGNSHITFEFAGAPPAGWTVIAEDESATSVYDEARWCESGSPGSVLVPWKFARPPSGFWVSWTNSQGRAWWPVNVESARALPPPDELRALPLDTLISILTSARPLSEVLKTKHNRTNPSIISLPGDVFIDPHKRVDTSQFLLQRTRRVSWGLTALRKRLEYPVATESSLDWRLRGPMGVQALIDAMDRDAHSNDEKTFLLCELALDLWRVKPCSRPGYLSAERVRAEIRAMLVDIRRRVFETLNGSASNLRAYVERVFETVTP